MVRPEASSESSASSRFDPRPWHHVVLGAGGVDQVQRVPAGLTPCACDMSLMLCSFAVSTYS